jgi:rhodanese-related sulfurtransferase
MAGAVRSAGNSNDLQGGFPMKTIQIDELKQMRDTMKPVIINVLDRPLFEREHIPGSINVPLTEDQFPKKVEEQVRGKDAPVVVYCASEECQASPKAASELEKAGFQNVYHFKGGMAEWKDAGRSVEAGA